MQRKKGVRHRNLRNCCVETPPGWHTGTEFSALLFHRHGFFEPRYTCQPLRFACTAASEAM